MEFELEDYPQQMGEDDTSDPGFFVPTRQRDRSHLSRPFQFHVRARDQAVFIPEQDDGSSLRLT